MNTHLKLYECSKVSKKMLRSAFHSIEIPFQVTMSVSASLSIGDVLDKLLYFGRSRKVLLTKIEKVEGLML